MDNSNVKQIQSDLECEKALINLKEKLNLSNEELSLLDSCIDSMRSSESTLGHIFGLSQLAMSHIEFNEEIMSCFDYIDSSIDYDNILPEGTTISLDADFVKMNLFCDEDLSDEDLSDEDLSETIKI